MRAAREMHRPARVPRQLESRRAHAVARQLRAARDLVRRVPVTQLVLEYATPRSGEVISPGGMELGLGVVNPRTATVETAERKLAVMVEPARRLRSA